VIAQCYNAAVLNQDRARDPVEDITSQLPPEAIESGAALFVVLPLDKAVELKARRPSLRVVLMQLDGAVIERLTNRPYDPKAEYEVSVVRQALKLAEVKKGDIKYMAFDDLRRQLEDKTVGVFNDVLRTALQGLIRANFVKTCGGVSGGCVEINPLGAKSGIRISFPPSGRLNADQMAEMIARGEARIYHLEIQAEEVPLRCQ
jgi:hypothetical protein